MAVLQLLAGLAVAERRIGGQFAAADVHHWRLLVQTKFKRLELSACVGPVAERLALRHPAAAPEVVFSAEQGVLDRVWSNAR